MREVGGDRESRTQRGKSSKESDEAEGDKSSRKRECESRREEEEEGDEGI